MYRHMELYYSCCFTLLIVLHQQGKYQKKLSLSHIKNTVHSNYSKTLNTPVLKFRTLKNITHFIS